MSASAVATNREGNSDRPLRILSLDGGGVRGLSELVILDVILHSVEFSRQTQQNGPNQRPLPASLPVDYFDLICGCSTGGLIALMLGRLNMTISQCLQEYVSISEKVFEKSRLLKGSKFEHQILEDEVKNLLVKRGLSADERLPATDCAIWEAVRATSAAPSYFDEITIKDASKGTSLTFIDGGIGYNNPAERAVEEARQIWPNREIGILLSIGTGTQAPPQFKTSFLGVQTQIAAAHFIRKKITECESAHNKMFNVLPPGKYFRFNVDYLGSVGIEEWKELPNLNALTHQYMAKATVLAVKERCAETLLSLTEGYKVTISDREAARAEGALKHALEERVWDRHVVKERMDDVIRIYQARNAPDQVHAWKVYVFNSLAMSDGMDIELAKLASEISGDLMQRNKYCEAADWSLKAYRYFESLNIPLNMTGALWAYLVSLHLLGSGDESEWKRYYELAKSYRHYTAESRHDGQSIFTFERNYLIAEQFVRRHILDEAAEHLSALWEEWYKLPDFLHGPLLRLMISLAEGYGFQEKRELANMWYDTITVGMERYGKVHGEFREHCFKWVEACRTGDETFRTDGPELPGWHLTSRDLRPNRKISHIFDSDSGLRNMLESFKSIERGQAMEDDSTVRRKQDLPPTLMKAYAQAPILFERTPPSDVVVPRIPDIVPRTLIPKISNLLTSPSMPIDEPLEALLVAWSTVMINLNYSDNNAWTIIDLLRAAMSSKKISRWFLQHAQESVETIIKSVTLKGPESWQLRLVTVRLVIIFLKFDPILIAGGKFILGRIAGISNSSIIRSEMISLFTTSLESPKLQLRKASASALFNLTQVLLRENLAPDEDDFICIIAGLAQSLNGFEGDQEDSELMSLLLVCLGGMIIVGKRTLKPIEDLLISLEVGEIISKMFGEKPEGKEIIELFVS